MSTSRTSPVTHTLVAGPFLGFYTENDGVGPDAGVTCELVEGADTAIDSFVVTAAATPTPTPTADHQPGAPGPRPDRLRG